MKIVQEQDIEELELTGRYMRVVFSPTKFKADNLSVCTIRLLPGQMVTPAHSHPNEEEVIYIIEGEGRVMIDGVAESVKKGTAVLFSPGSIHMLQNSEKGEMKVICFFSPPSDTTTYKYFPKVSFPQE